MHGQASELFKATIDGHAVYFAERTVLDRTEEAQLYDRASKSLGIGKNELLLEYEGLV